MGTDSRAGWRVTGARGPGWAGPVLKAAEHADEDEDGHQPGSQEGCGAPGTDLAAHVQGKETRSGEPAEATPIGHAPDAHWSATRTPREATPPSPARQDLGVSRGKWGGVVREATPLCVPKGPRPRAYWPGAHTPPGDHAPSASGLENEATPCASMPREATPPEPKGRK